jgi:hypothetical protein
VSLRASTTAHLRSGEQRGLKAGRMMVYWCRVEELSAIMVALTVGLTSSVR